MCYWKQWRWARTKIRHMLSLGVALKAAIQHGVSSLRRVGRKVVQWTALRLRTAHGQNPGDAAGHVQYMAQGARIAQREGPLVQDSGIFGLTFDSSSSEPTC
jgi:hypothetical protein